MQIHNPTNEVDNERIQQPAEERKELKRDTTELAVLKSKASLITRCDRKQINIQNSGHTQAV
jgi:hypothetical protein